MKKKLWCVLCIMICMMMIAACGQKKNPEKKKSEKAEQEETEFKDRESLKLSLFTVYYPKAWNYDKENMKKDEEYSYVRFFDGDTVDGSENVISIEATKEDSYTYRKSLIAFGVDLEAYAEGKMDTVTIGNAEYTAMPESNSIEKTYMYRYEQSGTSYDIRVRGQEIDDSDKELLEGIPSFLSSDFLVHAIIHTITLNTSGTAGKCIEGREFIIALPESFVEYKADDQF